MSQVKDDKKKMQQKPRRSYQKPHLLVYGAVKELTAGGGGSTVEDGKAGTKKP